MTPVRLVSSIAICTALASSPAAARPGGGGGGHFGGGFGGGGARSFAAPHFSAPHFSAPRLSAPHFSAPRISAPHFSAPRISAPHFSRHEFQRHVSLPMWRGPRLLLLALRRSAWRDPCGPQHPVTAGSLAVGAHVDRRRAAHCQHIAPGNQANRAFALAGATPPLAPTCCATRSSPITMR